MTEIDQTLAAITYAMRMQGKTQAQLMQVIGRSNKYVSEVLRGRADMRLSELVRIADWLGVPAPMLMQGIPTITQNQATRVEE